MPTPTASIPRRVIVRLVWVLTSGLAFSSSLGCALVQIPSYRLEDEAVASHCSQEMQAASGPLPTLPLPGWLARWKAEKDLPKPPDSPRFHPLPTRPMFSPSPSLDNGVCFGQMPDSQAWNLSPNEQIQSQMLPAPQ